MKHTKISVFTILAIVLSQFNYASSESAKNRYTEIQNLSTSYNYFTAVNELTADTMTMIPTLGAIASYFTRYGLRKIETDQLNNIKVLTNQLLKDEQSNISQITGDSKADIINRLDMHSKLATLVHKGALPQHLVNIVNLAITDQLTKEIILVAGKTENNTKEIYALKKEFKDSLEKVVKQNYSALKENIDNIKGSLEQAKEAIEKEINKDKDEIFARIDEEVKNVTNLTLNITKVTKNIVVLERKIENEKDEDKKKLLEQELAKEKENKRKKQKEETAQNQKMIETFSENMQGFAQLMLFINPVLAKDIQVVTNVMVKTASLINGIMSTSAASMTLGPYGAVASAAFSMFSHFKNKNQPSAEEVISKQIVQLSKQVEALREQMHMRFDRLEDLVLESHKQIIDGLATLSKQNLSLQEQISYVQSSLTLMENEISLLNQNVKEYFLDVEQFKFDEIYHHCITSKPATTEISPYLSKESFVDCTKDFVNWGTNAPVRKTFIGTSQTTYKELAQSYYLRPGMYEYMVNKIRSFYLVHGVNSIPSAINPIVWGNSTEAYISVLKNNPVHGKPTIDNIQTLVRMGRELVKPFVDAFYSNTDFLNIPVANIEKQQPRLSQIWNEAYSQILNEEFSSAINNYLTRNEGMIDFTKDNDYTSRLQSLPKETFYLPRFRIQVKNCSNDSDKGFSINPYDILNQIGKHNLLNHLLGKSDLALCYELSGNDHPKVYESTTSYSLKHKLKNGHYYKKYDYTISSTKPSHLILKGSIDNKKSLNIKYNLGENCHMPTSPAYWSGFYDNRTFSNVPIMHEKQDTFWTNHNWCSFDNTQMDSAKNTLQKVADEINLKSQTDKEVYDQFFHEKVSKTFIEKLDNTLLEMPLGVTNISDYLEAQKNMFLASLYFAYNQEYQLRPDFIEKVQYLSRTSINEIASNLFKENSDQRVTQPFYDIFKITNKTYRKSNFEDGYAPYFATMFRVEESVKLLRLDLINTEVTVEVNKLLSDLENNFSLKKIKRLVLIDSSQLEKVLPQIIEYISDLSNLHEGHDYKDFEGIINLNPTLAYKLLKEIIVTSPNYNNERDSAYKLLFSIKNREVDNLIVEEIRNNEDLKEPFLYRLLEKSDENSINLLARTITKLDLSIKLQREMLYKHNYLILDLLIKNKAFSFSDLEENQSKKLWDILLSVLNNKENINHFADFYVSNLKSEAVIMKSIKASRFKIPSNAQTGFGHLYLAEQIVKRHGAELSQTKIKEILDFFENLYVKEQVTSTIDSGPTMRWTGSSSPSLIDIWSN